MLQHRIVVKSVLIVALSEEIDSNEENGMPLQSEIHLRNINNVIKGVTIDNPDKDNYDEINDDYDETNITESWTTWADNMFLEAQEVTRKSNNGTVINAYYNVEAAKKKLLSYLPLWSGIMRPYFKYSTKIASLSYVEAEFADLKTRAFNNRLPMRVDKFIFHHIEYLDGKLKLTSGEANQEVIMNENISSKIFSPMKRQYEDVDEVNVEMDKTERDSLNETENWRCKIKSETSANNPVSKRLKSNYLTPCRLGLH